MSHRSTPKMIFHKQTNATTGLDRFTISEHRKALHYSENGNYALFLTESQGIVRYNLDSGNINTIYKYPFYYKDPCNFRLIAWCIDAINSTIYIYNNKVIISLKNLFETERLQVVLSELETCAHGNV